MPAVGIRSRAGAVLCVVVVALGLWGCGGGVQVTREGADSGVVLYVYKGRDGHLRTANRPEAFAAIQDFCRGPYRVVKEGQAKSRQRVIEDIGGQEIVTEHRWGIRFRCEASAPSP